jgi:signal transduction histidine kinase
VGKEEGQAKDLSNLLLDLTYNVSLAADFSSALSALRDRLCDLVPSDGSSVMWLDGDYLQVLVSRGSTAPLRGLTLPVGQVGAARAALDSGKPVLVPDTLNDHGWQQIPGEEAVRAWLAVPLRVDNWTLGLLEWTAETPGSFGEQEVQAAGAIGRSVAPALHRAQLLDDARRRLSEWMQPDQAPLSGEGLLPAQLQPLVNEARELTGAKHAFAFLRADGDSWLRCAVASGPLRDRIREIALRGDGTLGGWRVPLAGPIGQAGTSLSDRDLMARVGIVRTLILPLRVGGRQAGMLGVAEPPRGQTFGQGSIRLMTQIASQAAMAVERAYQRAPRADSYDYSALFRSSPLGVAVLTVGAEIQLGNPASAMLLTGRDQNLRGRRLADMVHAQDAPRLLRALQEAAITEQLRQVDARVPLTPEEHRHLRISIAVAQITGAAGGDLVAIMEDVTPLKILEEERVGHLQQLKERHAQLQELDELKTQFVSNVSHELRTPLAVIKLYATLARKGRPEKRDHYLSTIERETRRLETLVENILDLSRMDRDALPIEPEWLAVDELVTQVLQVYSERVEQQSIDLRNYVGADLPPLWADRNHLIQILTNLVDNALSYTPTGGQVWLAARDTEVEGQWMFEIEVGDTGMGVPAEERDKVFERFYRGSNVPSTSPGTGLGLAIVRELMRRHDGSVTLAHRDREGSVFTLRFPLPEDPSSFESLFEESRAGMKGS